MNTHIDEIYKDLLQDVLSNGEIITDGRTKESYRSVFGRQYRVNLRDGFPALTTKKLFFRGIAVELIWFLSGNTNVKFLQDNNVHIWDEWATKEQCARFNREEGELGPVYGELWRTWKAHDGRLIDQIQYVIDRIKTNPSCRRLIVSGWNPATINDVALPPCHTLFQFKVSHSGTRLNCHLYQRSADLFLGVPFNIASYALLTHMIAQVTNLEVGDFIHSFGDLHIYENHIEVVNEQLTREAMPLSHLELNKNITRIEDFNPQDIKLLNYTSHPALKAPVAV